MAEWTWLLLTVAALPDAATLQQQALAARKAVLTGDIRYEIASSKPRDDEAQPFEWGTPRFRDHLVFDLNEGWHAFLDRWVPFERSGIVNGVPLTMNYPEGGSCERIIIRPDLIYQWYPGSFEDGTVVGIGELQTSNDLFEMQAVFHPWKFGMMPNHVDDFLRTELEAYVANVEQNNITVVEEPFEGVNCYRVEYLSKDDVRITTWFDPSKAMNVVKVSATGTNTLGTYVVTIVSTLQHFPEAGVWYPQETIYTSKSTGRKTPSYAERIRFSDVKLNIPVSPEQFTVKALEAPPHTGIVRGYDKPGPSEEWDGEKVDVVRRPPQRRHPSTAPNPEQSPAVGRRSRLPWILLGGNLLGFALLTWAMLYRKSPESVPNVNTVASPTKTTEDSTL